MKMSRYFIFLIFQIVSVACFALVNPESTTLAVPGWSAEIYVVGKNNTRTFYCKGSLIASRWVLSAAPCYFDPFKAKDTGVSRSNPVFVIKLGSSETYLEVADHIDSDDFDLTMWRLAKPVTNTPLKLSSKKNSQLFSTPVQILGTQSSLAAKHIFYNPYQGANITCTVDGTTFRTTDTLCYLLGRSTTSSTLLSTAGVIIDPKAPDAPNSVLDRALTIDTTGASLYVDFRSSNSYPCHEDLGAPVLVKNLVGEFEQVGVITGAGMTAGVPMCTQTLANVISSVAHFQPFITETIVDYEFGLLCPAAPKPKVAYTGGAGITLSWPAVEGATGYRILYTTSVGYSAIKTVDVKTQTQVSTNLNPALTYSASVTAYNDSCSGPRSELLTIDL